MYVFIAIFPIPAIMKQNVNLMFWWPNSFYLCINTINPISRIFCLKLQEPKKKKKKSSKTASENVILNRPVNCFFNRF